MESSGTQTNTGTDEREQFMNEQSPIGLPWRLTVFSIIIFALSIFGYLGLHFGYRTYLTSQAKGLDNALTKLAEQVSADEQDKFISFYSQILNLKTVLEKHVFTANVFPFLERNVVPNVFFTNAEFDGKTYGLQLDGVGQTFENVAQQISVFTNAPEVANASLDKIVISNGSVLFTVSLSFKADTFMRSAL